MVRNGYPVPDRWGKQALDAERRTAAAGRLGVGILDGESAAGDVVDEIDLGAAQVARADGIDEQLDAVRLEHGIGGLVSLALVDHEAVLETGTAASLNEHAETSARFVFFSQ